MEEKINIAKILKDKPVNTKLYSPLYGDVYFSYIGVRNNICVLHHRFTLSDFFYNGRYTAYKESEIMLFPSKDMRDWSKFAWKRGDVLISDCGFVCIFKEWASDDYTRFNGCYFDGMPNAETAKYSKLDNNTAYGYIRELEKRCGGVLNIKTLRIEKSKPDFKDGDIAFADYGNRQDVFIVSDKTDLSEGYSSFISLDLNSLTLSIGCRTTFFKKDLCKLRLATEEEKKKLFSALEKEGKAWDAEKKQIVDLKKKWTPNPFDRVITRNDDDDIWTANIFSHMDSHGEYVTIGCVGGYTYCIPYNEDTAKLIGTTNNVEG